MVFRGNDVLLDHLCSVLGEERCFLSSAYSGVVENIIRMGFCFVLRCLELCVFGLCVQSIHICNMDFLFGQGLMCV